MKITKVLIVLLLGTASSLGASLTKTTTVLKSAPNPSTYGQAVTFTAVVGSSTGAPPDGETVSFLRGKTALGIGVLSGGSATFTTSTLAGGTDTLTAVYAGDSNFGGSTSTAVKQAVTPATTTTSLAASQNPSNVGQSVTFTASVASSESSGAITGSVTFYDGSKALGTVSLSGAVAQYRTASLPAGTDAMTAVYKGSSSFSSSTSGVLSQTVGAGTLIL